jgi:Flp pilus assembly protein TadD
LSRRFFAGRSHDRLDQRPAAEAAYRAALEVFPRAQSASLALATLLYMRGERTEARRLPLYINEMRARLKDLSTRQIR